MSDVSTPSGAKNAPQSGDVSGAVVPESDGVGFTPGPWILVTHHRYGSDGLIPVWYIKASNDVGIAVQPSFSCPDHERANARLIAAAPDLYDAVRVALGWATGGMDGDWRECYHIEVMRAALAKATAPPQESTAPASSPVPEVTGA